jgi:putative glycosyltransferase (TIGR04372 family)
VQYALISGGRHRVLLTRPDTHAYGNAILNMAWSFHLARRLGARLYVSPLDPSRLVELTGLECEGVRRLETTPLRTRGLHALVRWLAGPLRAVGTLAELGGGGRGQPDERGYFGMDFRREAIASPLRVRLPPALEASCRRVAESLGLVHGPWVVLHVREAGHAAARGLVDREKDTARNAKVETYREAIAWLVSRGYRVVRVGDPRMTPLELPGVVDLATSPGRTLGLELWCAIRSRFLITSDSGPFNLSVLTGVPGLGVNITHLLGAYPLRAHDRSILKHVVDAESGQALGLADMLTPAHLKQRWIPGRFQFVDNSPREILEAVQEMDSVTAGMAQVSDAQHAVRQAMSRFLDSDAGRRKQKSGAFYLGDGFIGDAFAHRSLT